MRSTALLAVLLAWMASGLGNAARGETWWVNNETGRDSFDGRSASPKGDGVHGPFATVKRAVAALKTSDRLEIANTARPYRELIAISKGGTPEAPLVVDGHGATVDGLDAVPAAEWRPEPGGTFWVPFATNANKLERVKDVMTWIGAPQIWFVDGQAAPNAKSAAELAHRPGGFYWNKGQHRLYFKPPAGKRPADLRIEIPRRGTGISVYGADYIVVENFRTLHSLNDGVGTAHCRGVVFRHDNCDQGFSAHDGAVNIIEDCRLERNAGSGICDVGNSVTIFRRCLVAHNTFESGAYFLNEGFHLLEDCAVLDNDDGPQVMAGGEGWTQLRNCVVCGKAGNAAPLIQSQGGNVALEHCTVADGVVGVEMARTRGVLRISNCLFTRCRQALAVIPRGAQLRFSSDYNGWHLGVLDFGGVRYGPGMWSDYQKASRQDAHSLAADPRFLAGTGPAADDPCAGGFAAFVLPPDSPYLVSGERGRSMGAILQGHGAGKR
jgi:hypothetical protein